MLRFSSKKIPVIEIKDKKNFFDSKKLKISETSKRHIIGFF